MFRLNIISTKQVHHFFRKKHAYSDGNYKKVKINIGITNRHNSTYENNESHLINKHIKNGNNIQLDCHQSDIQNQNHMQYMIIIKLKKKKIESSNVIKQNAVEHLKSHIKKPLVLTL